MEYRMIDMASYKRRRHFAYFNSLAYPYVGTTAQVDITSLLAEIQARRLPFFLTFCHCAARAANQIPELRQRIVAGRIVEFETCPTIHTVALEDETYCSCTLEHTMPFAQYLPYAVRVQEEAKGRNTLRAEGEETLRLLFVSTLPWFSYTSLTQPVPIPADSNPRLTWGRYTRRDGKVWIPVTLLCHHGLADGVHLAKFYRLLSEEGERLAQELHSGAGDF